MTIASEITRLQNDKAAICCAIENKGVTVGNITLDNYASCIDAIPTGGKFGYIDLLVVAGGGDGGVGERYNYGAGGGGGGGVIIRCGYPILSEGVYSICVGGRRQNSEFSDGCSTLLACRGGDGANYGGSRKWCGCLGGSGGGGSRATNCPGGGCVAFEGHCGGYGGNCGGGGGGGAGGCGAGGSGNNGGKGGDGILNDFSGVGCYYGGGGGGGTQSGCNPGAGGCGGGNGGPSGQRGCNATYYGGGGGGGSVGGSSASYNTGGAGCQGVVIIRYKTDGSCGISPSSTGGCKYTCGNYTIHCFCTVGTSTFTPAFT